MLRDVARQHALNGQQVSIVDELSELAACRQGVPQLDVGPSTDVLDACPKAEGMILMLRVFSPDVLITDEIGKTNDAEAIDEASRCGAAVVTSAHAGSLEELMQRPITGVLLRQRSFDRYVQLGPGGRVLKAWNGAFGVLYDSTATVPPTVQPTANTPPIPTLPTDSDSHIPLSRLTMASLPETIGMSTRAAMLLGITQPTIPTMTESPTATLTERI
jgi:hypothetical protein